MSTLINKDKYSLKIITVNRTEVYGTELIPAKTIVEKGRFFWLPSKIRTEKAKWKTKYGFVFAENIAGNKDYIEIDGKLMTRPTLVLEFTNNTSFLERFENDEELDARIEQLEKAFKTDMFEINQVVTRYTPNFGGY